MLWPPPTQRLPFGASTGVPPVRPAVSGTPSRSTNGPNADVERPAKTAYPDSGPVQHVPDDTNR